MKKTFRNRRGSLTILAIFIFLIMMTSITLILRFSMIQAALSRNQLEKIQSRYKVEDGFNKILYQDDNMEKYLRGDMLYRYRERTSSDKLFKIIVEEGDELKSYIKNLEFSFKNINGREMIFLKTEVDHNNLTSYIKAHGLCVNQIFELKKPILDENLLSTSEEDLFIKFMDDMENNNWDYEFQMGSNYKKINTKKDVFIKFVSKNRPAELGVKGIMLNFNEVNQTYEEFKEQFVIIHLKRDNLSERSITIGSTENKELITIRGVLYVEGDLIINQDFTFEGLIIMNGGKIIVNSINKPIIKGMVINKGEEIDKDTLDLIHDQLSIYRAGSFLPGFLDIGIQVIKKY